MDAALPEINEPVAFRRKSDPFLTAKGCLENADNDNLEHNLDDSAYSESRLPWGVLSSHGKIMHPSIDDKVPKEVETSFKISGRESKKLFPASQQSSMVSFLPKFDFTLIESNAFFSFFFISFKKT